MLESYLVGLFENSILCAIHDGRSKLEIKDMQIANRIKDDSMVRGKKKFCSGLVGKLIVELW